MGCWDDKCIICGAPPSNTDYGVEKVYEELSWLENCTLLLPNGAVVHNYEEVNCNIHFRYTGSGDNGYPELDSEINDINFTAPIINWGIWVHTDCYAYCTKYLDTELKFNNLPYVKSVYLDLFNTFKYGGIEKYGVEQAFPFEAIHKDNNQWMIISPLDKSEAGNKNRNRINKILSQMKLTPSEIKKRTARPSPPISATLVKDKTYMIGNDDKVWQVNNSKWKIQNTFYEKSYEMNFPEDLNIIGMRYSKNESIFNLKLETVVNKVPIFITFFDYGTYDGGIRIKDGVFTFMSNDEGFEILIDFFNDKQIQYRGKNRVNEQSGGHCYDYQAKYHKYKIKYLNLK
jgi:hypothetical protein